MVAMIWLAVTADQYELPFAVADTAAKLAKKMKVTEGTIRSRECRKCSGRNSGYKIVKVKDE